MYHLPRTALTRTAVSQEDGATDKARIEIADIRGAVAETTRKLGTVPDLFLIHNRECSLYRRSLRRCSCAIAYVPPEGKLVEAWQELEALKDEGKLKSIGVSNFRPQDLELILASAKHKPVVNQVRAPPPRGTHCVERAVARVSPLPS
jgi:diketogulonate reductase-like aldo/keto reductase